MHKSKLYKLRREKKVSKEYKRQKVKKIAIFKLVGFFLNSRPVASSINSNSFLVKKLHYRRREKVL